MEASKTVVVAVGVVADHLPVVCQTAGTDLVPVGASLGAGFVEDYTG